MMITNYNEFISEGLQRKRDDPRFWDIFDCVISEETGRYNINTAVDWSGDDLLKRNIDKIKKFPFPIGMVKYYFNCSNNNLTTLENGPTWISGAFFDCSNNKLSDLKFFPRYVKGDVCVGGNDLTIEDYPYLTHISGKIYGDSLTMEYDSYHFNDILTVVRNNYKMMLDYMIANNPVPFHQQIMRLCPDLIQYYTKIKPPTKKTII